MAGEPPTKKSKVENGTNVLTLPEVEVTLQTGEMFNIGKKYAKGILVLFAYPKASTPGCTRQTSGFGELYPQFQKLNAAVYGVSADSPKAQITFKEKTGVDFDLISDPDYLLLDPLGAKKSASGGVVRSHWVFVNGSSIFDEHGVKPGESPKETLEAVTNYEKNAEAKTEAKEDEKNMALIQQEEEKEEVDDDENDEDAEPEDDEENDEEEDEDEDEDEEEEEAEFSADEEEEDFDGDEAAENED